MKNNGRGGGGGGIYGKGRKIYVGERRICGGGREIEWNHTKYGAQGIRETAMIILVTCCCCCSDHIPCCT